MVDVEEPLCIEIEPHDCLETDGPLANRAREFALRFAERFCGGEEPRRRIQILSAPSPHVGLGTGTQLGIAVAAGLAASYGMGGLSVMDLARSVGRGKRSAVGTYGFAAGGLIVEAGKLPGESISPLVERVELPEFWRIVLICDCSQERMAGKAERLAFGRLPPVAPKVTQYLRKQVDDRILPGAKLADMDLFGEGLHDFGRAAGKCFAAVQGGAYASQRLAQLVKRIRGMGVRGVGQSSWGPTLFAFVDSRQKARSLARCLLEVSGGENRLAVSLARPNNSGARLQNGNKDFRNPESGIVLYTRHGCHLCDDALAVLRAHGCNPQVIEVESDPDLLARFDTCVPVVLIDGRMRFRGRVEPRLLKRILKARPEC